MNDQAYDGTYARTRTETLPLAQADGAITTVEVVRVVDAASDAALAERARRGALHRLDDGRTLALSFAYHDPGARRFLIVVPDAIAHAVFRERAAWLERLAEDPGPVPAYVARAEWVLLSGLEERLAEEPITAARAALDADAEARQALLEEREQRLRARAEAVTSREDELRMEGERLEATRRELALRESELEGRLASLLERERAAAAETASLVTTDELEAAEVFSAEATDAHQAIDASALDVEDVDHEVVDDEVEELEAEPTRASDSPRGLIESVRLVEPGPSLEDEVVEEIDPELADDVVESADPDLVEPELVEPELLEPEFLEDVAELVDDDHDELDDSDVAMLDDDLVEELVEEQSATGVHQSEAPRAVERGMPDVAMPPAELFVDGQVQMLAAMREDQPWLYARVEEGHEDAFGSEPDLLVQYVAVEDDPVVLLALVDWAGDRPYVRRAAFDPRRQGDRAILDRLRQDLRVTIALFGPQGTYERTLELHVPERQLNLAMALDHADRCEGQGDPVTAMERALAAPPPVRLRGHPFREAPDAETAADALRNVAALSKWSTPVKLELALLGLSLPRQLVDESFRRVLDDALRHGVSLPERLITRAVSLGVAAEPGDLVLRIAGAFRGTAALPDRGGLSVDDVARNWEQLLQTADRYEVALDDATHERALQDMHAAKGQSAPSAIDAEELDQASPARLAELLEHPKVRREAALRIVALDDAAQLPAVLRAARKMPRDEVLDVLPRVLPFGEDVADGLIDALGARKTFVRQAAAIALGELQLRRAISPLVQLLRDEPTDVWFEVGRVIALFGNSAVRTLARAMREPKGANERFAYTLAHMARLGVDKAKSLEKDDDKTVRSIALEAITHRQKADDHAARVKEGGDLPKDDVHLFSHRFYGALPE